MLLLLALAGAANVVCAAGCPRRRAPYGDRRPAAARSNDDRRGRTRQRAAAQNNPAGFALDATHRPHITLLQRYVLTSELPAVYAAVERVLNQRRPIGWELEATGYYYLDFNNMALAGIVIRPTPELRRLQLDVVDAVAPYTRSNGTAAAYVRTAAEPGINLPTLDYVNAFVPERTGENFNPHVTIGVGHIPFVQKMKAAAFPTFKFRIAGAAVFHLGNFGTAAKELWAWQPTAGAGADAADPLPSWNDGPAKAAILKFVRGVTTEGEPDYVSPHERIATFDNDGTLWCEMPIYTQCAFAIDRVKQLAPQHPDWRSSAAVSTRFWKTTRRRSSPPESGASSKWCWPATRA